MIKNIFIEAEEFLNFSLNEKNLLFFIAYHEKSNFLQKHIKNSLYLETDEIEELPYYQRKSFEDLSKLLKRFGLNAKNEQLILIYSSKNNMAASRFGLILLSMGIDNFKILNGGFSQENFGYSEQIVQKKQEDYDFWLEQKFQENIQVSLKEEINYKENKNIILTGLEVLEIQKEKPNLIQIVDIRRLSEHNGTEIGYEYMNCAGRPLGCIWGGDINDYIDIQTKKMKTENQILQLLQEKQINYQEKQIFLFCGTGWRVSEVYLYLNQIGITNVCIFNGWFEWYSLDLPCEIKNYFQ